MSASQDDLEAAIDAAPDDPAAYAAYGAWLSARGDPRGELVAVQVAQLSAKGLDLARLEAREQEILDAHAATLAWPERPDYWVPRVEWFCGFFRAAGDFVSVDGHPSSRFLRHASTDLRAAIPTLATWRAPLTARDVGWLAACPRLRALHVDERQLRALPPDVFERLETLHVDAFDPPRRLTEIAMPRLRTLGLRVFHAWVDVAVAAIERLRPPELSLDVSGQGGVGPALAKLAAVAPLVTSLRLESLSREHLWAPLAGVVFPNARALDVSSPGLDLEPAAYRWWAECAPAARRVVVGADTDDRGTFAERRDRRHALASSALGARVVELELRLGQEHYGGTRIFGGTLPALERLDVLGPVVSPGAAARMWRDADLDAEHLPSLRALSIDVDGQVAPIAASSLAAQLEELTVRIDGDDGARAFLDARDRFPRLRTLGITGVRRFSRAVREALRSLDVDVERRPLHPIVFASPDRLAS